MAQSGAHHAASEMNIDDQKQTFGGFLTATVWTCVHIAQAVMLLTLAFAIGSGWWAGVGAYIAIGIVAGLIFRMGATYWAAQIAQWVLLVIGGMIVPFIAGLVN